MSAKVDARKVMAELRRLRERAPNLADRMVGRWAENLVSEMKMEEVVPRDTGRLRDSHGWERLKAGVFRLFCNTTYAAAVHETHKQKPRWFAKVLADKALKTLRETVNKARAEFEKSGEIEDVTNGTKPAAAARAGERTYRKEMTRRSRERAKKKRNGES